MKFEDTSAETRSLSKSSCFAGSVAARTDFSIFCHFFFLPFSFRRDVEEDGGADIESHLRSQSKPTLDGRTDLSKWQ